VAASTLVPASNDQAEDDEDVTSDLDVSDEEEEDAVYDQKENLARHCREFYERRMAAAETAAQRWSSSPSSGHNSPASACSSGYFSLNQHHTAGQPRETKERGGGDLGGGARENGDDAGDDKKAGGGSQNRMSCLDVDASGQLQARMDTLRLELLSLMRQDDELFKQLLTLNDTIEELKEERGLASIGRGVTSMTSIRNVVTSSVPEEEEEEDHQDEINDLLDEALLSDLDDEVNERAVDVPEDIASMTKGHRSLPVSRVQTLSRSNSAFQRQRVSFPAARRNRRQGATIAPAPKQGAAPPRPSPPLRRELPTPPSTTVAGYSTLPGKARTRALPHPLEPPPPPPPPAFRTSTATISVTVSHVKQRSIDSGVTSCVTSDASSEASTE